MTAEAVDYYRFVTVAGLSSFFTAISLGIAVFYARDRRQALIAAIVITAVLLLEEVSLNSIYMVYGMALALAAMIIFPLLSTLVRSNRSLEGVFQVTGLIFANRVSYYPFSEKYFSLPGTLPGLYLLTFLACAAFIAAKKLDLKEVGITRGTTPLRSQLLLSLPVGIASGAAEYLLLRPPPLTFRGDPVQSMLYVIVVMLLFVGVTEELLFRGLFQSFMTTTLPTWIAVHISSTLFGLMHIGWQNITEVLFAYLMGLIFGFTYLRFRSLVAPILMHGLGNIVMFQLTSAGSASLPVAFWLLTLSAPLAGVSIIRSRKYFFAGLGRPPSTK